MARSGMPQWPIGVRTVFFDDEDGIPSQGTLGRAVSEGRLRRLAPRLYSPDLASDPAEIVMENLWRILGRMIPGAVIVDRSAAEGGKVVGGALFVASEVRRSTLRLPGVEVRVRPGGPINEPIEDPIWPAGLRMSSPARTLVDNLEESRPHKGRLARTLSMGELEDWLARKAVVWDEKQIARLRDNAVDLAKAMQAPGRIDAIHALFHRLAGRESLSPDSGELFAATVRGQAWDERRVEMFERMAQELKTADVPDGLPEEPHNLEQPFFESYFSNYIEGTIFTVAEARDIVETQQPPATRPADGHDILGTYRCVVDPIGRRDVSEDAKTLMGYLCERHKMILSGRPEMRPGQWKQEANQVGSYVFVTPNLVEGTLLRGFELASSVPAGFCRALFIMVVVSEVHPFIDGNGRAARVMMNAELSAVEQARIIIPSVYRNEYVACLRRTSVSEGADVTALVKVMGFAWRWTAAMPWEDRAATAGQLEATYALSDPDDSAISDIRLRLP